MIKRDIFQAIADPARRKILSLSAARSMTPNQLAEHFEFSRQAVSKHIQVLVESELLEQEQSGREIFYSLNVDKMKEFDEWLEPFRQMWEERFSELDKLLKKRNNKK